MRGNTQHYRRRLITAAVVLTSISCYLVLTVVSWNVVTIVGRVRPPVHVATVDGTSVVLPIPYGRPMALVFFLVSCPHCQRELAHLRRIVPLVPTIDVLAISLSGATETRRLTDSLALPFPVVRMNVDDATRLFGVMTVPTTLFVNSADVVVSAKTGARLFDEDSLRFVRFGREGVVQDGQ